MRVLGQRNSKPSRKSLIFCVLVNYISEVVIWKGDSLNQAENYLGCVWNLNSLKI